MANKWKFWHVGVLVADIEKAAKYYEGLGIGPFEVPSDLATTDRKVYGKPAPDVKNLARMALLGPVEVELVQPVTGKSVQREFLDKHGEGINHIAFIVDNLDKETDTLIKKGFKIISSGMIVGGGGFAYFNTDKVGGVVFELVQFPPGISRPI